MIFGLEDRRVAGVFGFVGFFDKEHNQVFLIFVLKIKVQAARFSNKDFLVSKSTHVLEVYGFIEASKVS